MSRSPQDLYARLLSRFAPSRGYPLWTPEPSHEFLIERPEGLRIGDVGVITDDGGFDALFNLCLPPNHPFHTRFGVPDSFTCFRPEELEIKSRFSAEPDGQVILTPSVTKVGSVSSTEAPERDELGVSTYRFNLSSDQGALLILPEGAERLELLNDGIFVQKASQNGAEWYHYAQNRRHRIISQDALYVITGLYKTRSWSVAAFENVAGNESSTAYYKHIPDRSSTAQTYGWETTRASFDRNAGTSINHAGTPSQTVFIRGLKIALRNGSFGYRWVSVEADTPSTARSNPVKSLSVVANNILGDIDASMMIGDRGSTARTTIPTWRSTDATEEQAQNDEGMHVEIQRVPDVPPAFHPSNAINQYLLRKDPSANIAITCDSIWMSILEEKLLTTEYFDEDLDLGLEKVLSQNYDIVSHDGVVRLERKRGTLVDRQTRSIPPISDPNCAIVQSDHVSQVSTPRDPKDTDKQDLKQDVLMNESEVDAESHVNVELQSITLGIGAEKHEAQMVLTAGKPMLAHVGSGASGSSSTPMPTEYFMQGSVRGPVRSQHGRGRLVVEQNYARPNAQPEGTNHPASYNAQVDHPQPEFLTRVLGEYMNAQQQQNCHWQAFNTNTVMHEADMDNQVVSHGEIPGQEDTIRFRQRGHGVQLSPNQFSTTSLQPSHDQSRAFPLLGAPPVGSIGRSTILGNQPVRGPPVRRMMPTEFQEESYLRNGTLQSDYYSTSMGFQPKTYTSSTAGYPSMQQLEIFAPRRAETHHTSGMKEAYYGNPSPSNTPNTLQALQQQFEQLQRPDTQVGGLSTRTQPATAMISSGGIVREDTQKAHGHDPDRIHTGFSYDDSEDLFRYLTQEGDYPVAGGGYTDVFKGTLNYKQTPTKVAIKIIKVYSNENDSKKKLQRLLEREIELWKKLKHDNVLQLLGITSGYSTFPAMVCPWLENGTLTSHLERCGVELQMPRILMLIYEVSRGLQYLHSKSIIHGDLSGSNVLVDANGQACIADFGLSKILHESGVSPSGAPSSGKLRSTLRWVAPELLDLQEDRNAKSYTKPSDIYSFGGIMLQILSGKIPYHYYSRDAQVVKAISEGETTKRPNDPRVTNRRWMFIQRCWSPFSMVHQRPSSDEIVAFSKDDLVGKDIQAGATGVVHGSRYPMP